MNRLIKSVVLACLVVLPSRLQAQGGWRLALTAGPFRVDEIAGTPIVPAASLIKAVGSRTQLGGTLGWIRDAGRYGLDALTLDLHLGLRIPTGNLEWSASAGPTAIVGGDGDGTPYVAGGVQGTAGANWWVAPRVGFTASATGRLWVSSGNSRFSPALGVGLVFRL